MSDPMVTVLGPHNRHIEVHKSTQEALPDAFPLAPTTPAPKKQPSKAAAKRLSTKPADEPEVTPTTDESDAPDSSATADETDTVDTTKEAR
jgi:hypothetical protein